MNETYDALLAASSSIWPESDGSPERAVELVLIPHARAPRLAVPAGNPRVLAEVLGRTSSDQGFAKRASRTALSLACRTPVLNRLLLARLRDRVTLSGRRASLEATLGELLDREVVVSFGVGNPRANRKPVLQVLTPHGETVAFAKLGTTAVTRELVRGETAALRSLGTEPARHFDVPRVLYAGAWEGSELLVMTPLRARGRSRGRSVPVEAMDELARRFGVVEEPLRDTEFWARILEVEELRALAAPVDAGQRVELGAWHGDWTPWNMTWDRDRVLLWDFERFTKRVPLGLDHAHYRLQETLRRQGETAAASLIAADGVDRLYLLELARRWVLASAPPEGEPLRRRTSWLLSVLGGTRP